MRKVPASIRNSSVSKLLSMHGHILDELRDRKITRSSNNPGGDYAEYLFAQTFDWRLTSNSNAGWDATGNGFRYQIKCRRMTRYNKSRQLSAIRKLELKQFDYLAAVIFNEDYSVHRAAIIPRARIKEPHVRFSKHVNGWLLRLADNIWTLNGVTDVTEKLKRVAARI